MPSDRSWLFMLSLGSLALVGPLAVHLFLPAMPLVKAEFHISDSMTQLTFSASMFAMAVSTLVYGALSDRYGRRPVLLAGLALFLAGSALSAAATSLTTLMIGRLVQAAGAGCGATIGRAIARDVYGAKDLVRAIAYLSMFYTLGPMLAPIVAGGLVDRLGWRWVFAFSLVAGLAITVGAVMMIEETSPGGERVRHGDRGSLIALFRSMLGDWIFLFSHPKFAGYVLQAGFNTGVFFTLSTASAVLMREQLGRPAWEFGLYFALFPLGFLAGSTLSTRLSRIASIEAMVLAGSSVVVVCVALQAVLFLTGHVGPTTFFVPGFLLTMSQGVSLPAGQAGAIGIVPRLAGTAAGVGVFAQTFVGAGAVQLYGLFADGTVRPLVVATCIGAILSLATSAVPWMLRGQVSAGGPKPGDGDGRRS